MGKTQMQVKFVISQVSVKSIAVADLGFPRRVGRACPWDWDKNLLFGTIFAQEFARGPGANTRGVRQPIIWQNLFRKLHENERIYTEKGALVPSAPGSATVLCLI